MSATEGWHQTERLETASGARTPWVQVLSSSAHSLGDPGRVTRPFCARFPTCKWGYVFRVLQGNRTHRVRMHKRRERFILRNCLARRWTWEVQNTQGGPAGRRLRRSQGCTQVQKRSAGRALAERGQSFNLLRPSNDRSRLTLIMKDNCFTPSRPTKM